MRRLFLLAAVLVLAGGAAFAGLRAAEDDSGSAAAPKAQQQGAPGSDSGRPGAGGEQGRQQGDGEPRLRESSCPPDLSNCVVASGRVIYVEAVDPDGDGDAHFVTTSEDGVTLPGITVFDVRADLRPEPLPGVGDLIGGAGPVYRGSRGQKQIEVLEFHVAR